MGDDLNLVSKTDNAPAGARETFFTSMSRLQAEFAAAVSDIGTRESALKEACDAIRYVLQGGIGKTAFKPTHELARFMTDFNDELASILKSWLERIETHERNTSFRKGFNDSLVVLVLGKVKAGKSSLGNYMAYGCTDPAGTPHTVGGPEFFTTAVAQGAGDQAEGATGKGGYFRIGTRETTKSIQGFRLPGLTWVDSPGLHSVTPANEALAKDYREAADLIVYPMHSANPGRKGDVDEIRELLRDKKRFLIVITQCDLADEDEAPDGSIIQNWVMKDQAARNDQIAYVREAVSPDGDAGALDILSLSVRYAERHDNQPAALEESGIADFFRLLTDVANSDGVRLKRETPSRNLNSFVSLVLGCDAPGDPLSVKRVHKRLDELAQKLKAAEADLHVRASRATAAVFRQIGPVVAEQIERHAEVQDHAGFEAGCREALRQIVAEEIRKELLTLLAAPKGTLARSIGLTEVLGFLKFKDVTFKVKMSNRKAIGAIGGSGGAAAGMWAGGELGGAMAGSIVPGIGNIIGAMVGGALGGLLGGIVGQAAGEAVGSDTEVETKSGDNRAEVEASAVKAMQDAGQAAVENFFARLRDDTLTPVQRHQAKLDEALRKFSRVLKTKVYSHD